MKISFIIGTRPELIKVAPLILEAQKKGLEFDVVNTAQHKDLLDPYWKTFDIRPTITLDVMVPGQNLSALTGRAINGLQSYIDSSTSLPDIILAQGDTTTVMAASIVSFYNKIKFAHLEAGLRSFDLYNPFPEELNRKIASIAANIHFCPTEESKLNLLKEGIVEEKIKVTGNTVVDSLNLIKSNERFLDKKWDNSDLLQVSSYSKIVLITCHRRENQGANLHQIIKAIQKMGGLYQNFAFVWTLHPNPEIRKEILNSELKNLSNVFLVDPLSYFDLIKMLDKSFCAISDSGGIQEEAPSFNTPVIVLRNKTERPEGVQKGYAFLVGADEDKIINTFQQLLETSPEFKENPYGDGQSRIRIIDHLINTIETLQ